MKHAPFFLQNIVKACLFGSAFCVALPIAAEGALAQSFFTPELFDNGSYASVILSMLAFLGSGFSFYMTALRRGKIEPFIPPTIRFDSVRLMNEKGFTERFNIPLTAVNVGARSATILFAALDVTNPRLGQTKSYYPASVGSFIDEVQGRNYPFSPVAITGRNSQTLQLMFIRKPGQDDTASQAAQDVRHIDIEGGVYDFRLCLDVVSAGKIKKEVKTFRMHCEKLDYRRFGDGGSMPMHDVDFFSYPSHAS